MMSEVFWSMFLTTSVAFVLAVGRLCYKSKCSSIELCCIKIVRNTAAEERADELELEIKASKPQEDNLNKV
jgi:hypothetical protein